MNTMQLQAMDRNGELPEVIFATSPHPLSPTCTGVGGEITDEPINNGSGTTWMGMRAAAWMWDDPAPVQYGFTIRQFATHWSTGPKTAERLYRESDVRALIATLTKNSEATP